MKTIPEKIYEILDSQAEGLRRILNRQQGNSLQRYELSLLEYEIDQLLGGCEDIETLTQAFVVLDAQPTERD